MTKTLESWMVKKAVKNGLGMKHLCETYELTESELIQKIHIFYRKNPDVVVAELRANDKRAAKRAKKEKAENKVKTELNPKPSPEPAPAVAENDAKSPVSRGAIQAEISVESGTDKIQRLESKETETRSKVAYLEAARKDLRGRYQNNVNKLQEIADAMALLEAEFDRKYCQAQLLNTENVDLKKQIDAIQEEMDTENKTLAAVRQQLDDLRKVELWIYADGTVGLADESFGIVLDDSGSEPLFRELMGRPECLDLTARNIMAIAKLFKILERLQQEGLGVKLVFDKEEVETAFHAISA